MAQIMLESLLVPILLLQEIPSEVVSEGLKINPYNALGYGALVVVLCVFCYFQYRERIKIQNMLFSHLEKSISLVTMVESKISIMEELKTLMIEIKHDRNADKKDAGGRNG